MITVFRLTKYSSGHPSGWNESFKKEFNDLAKAQAYARRQRDLLIKFEGMELEEIQHETFTAFFSHKCGTEVKLCMRGWQDFVKQ